jgi:LacI family transcriptional regulator
MNQKIRLVDVAKKAGVSVSTASEALNGVSGVNEKTRQKVIHIARQMNYLPNKSAQNLVRQTSHSIGVIMSGPTSLNWLSNPIFIEILRPIVETLNKKKINVLFEIATVETEIEVIRRIAQSGYVDAIILIGSRRKDDDLAELIEVLEIPTITTVRHPLGEGHLGAAVDNLHIGKIAAQHLISLGHRKLGYIGVLPGVSLAEERLKSFVSCCKKNGILLDPNWIRDGDFYQESGRREMKWLLKNTDVSGVFIANDLMATGAIEALLEMRVRVPEDISILGCDGIPNTHLLAIPLSTVALPIRDIGVTAAEQAIAILEGKKLDELQAKTFKPELVLRDSTGPYSLITNL